jgi:hypothetical protein
LGGLKAAIGSRGVLPIADRVGRVRGTVGFVDIVNPTAAEIRSWAMSRRPLPMQDWDLIIASDPNREDVFLELATEARGVKRKTFLGILYLIVGDAVRTNWHTRSREQVLNLIERSKVLPDESLRIWATRATELIANPGLFRYGLWCGGGYARKSIR